MDMPAASRVSAAPPWTARGPVILTALILAAAMLQQVAVGLNTDVSWLIIVSERMLGGDRLYVDVVELNPPASVLIYLPWVALAEALGVRAEAVVAAATFLLVGASLAVSSSILRHAPMAGGWLLPVAAFALLLVPGASFAQREHVALLCLLPWLAVMTVRAEGGDARPGMALLAGIGAGLTIAIKPPFALPVALPLLAVAVRQRSWRPLFGAEVLACGLVAASYAALVLLAFSAFAAEILPLIRDGYLQVREPLRRLLGAPLPLLALLAAGTAVTLERKRLGYSPALMPLLAAAGFAIAMLAQGKGFANHHLPALALALMALGAALQAGDSAGRLAGGAVLAILAVAAAFVAGHVRSYPETEALVRQAAPANPSIIVAGTNLSIGHPLTRRVGGRWAGTSGSLWVTGTAHQLIERTDDAALRTRLHGQIARDRRAWVADVRRHNPDIILADGARGLAWLRSDPELSGAVRNYRVAGTREGIVVLVR